MYSTICDPTYIILSINVSMIVSEYLDGTRLAVSNSSMQRCVASLREVKAKKIIILSLMIMYSRIFNANELE